MIQITTNTAHLFPLHQDGTPFTLCDKNVPLEQRPKCYVEAVILGPQDNFRGPRTKKSDGHTDYRG